MDRRQALYTLVGLTSAAAGVALLGAGTAHAAVGPGGEALPASLGATFKVRAKDLGQFIALESSIAVLVSGEGSGVAFLDEGKKWQISSSQFLTVNGSNRVIVGSSEDINWDSWTSGNPIKYNSKDVYALWDATLNKYVLAVYTDNTAGPDFESVATS